jgi:uncharacterized membrane protein
MTIEYALPTFVILTILLTYWFLPSLMPETLPFGVRIPLERAKEPVIAHVKRDYHTGLIIIALLIGSAGWFCNTHYSAYLAGIGGLFCALILAGLNYYGAHKRLADAKARGNWYQGLKQVVMTDTSLHDHPIRPSIVWLLISLIFLMALIIIAIIRYPALPTNIPVHFGVNGLPNRWANKTVGVIMLPLFALIMTVFQTIMAYRLPNTRQQLDPANPTEDMQRQRKQRTMLGNMLLICSAIVNLSFFLIALVSYQVLPTDYSQSMTLIITLLATILPLGIVTIAMMVMYKQNRISLQPTPGNTYVARDDDRYWIIGSIYYNPDDPALMVSKRFGIGWTINFGHPQAKFLVAAFVVVIVLITII